MASSAQKKEKPVKTHPLGISCGGGRGGSSVQTCGTMKMYCIVKANAATERDNTLLNYSAIIYLQLIRLCRY